MTYNQLSKDDINEKLKEKMLVAIGDYKNTKSKTLFKCLVCGKEFESRYDNIRYWKGVGCTYCKNTYNSNLQDRKNNKIKNLDGRINPNVEFIDFVDDSLKNVRVKCNICGDIFTTQYSCIRNGSMHRPCVSKINGKSMLLPIEELENRLKLYGKDITVDYSNYNSSNSELLCKCNVCGYTWYTRARNISRDRQCPNCSRIKASNSRKKALSCYGDILEKYNLEIIGEYDCASKPILVRCKICMHEFETTVLYLKQNEIGCIKCNESERKKERYLLFLEEIDNANIRLCGDFYGMNTITTFYCEKCNKTFERTPHDFSRNRTCPHCVVNSKLEYLIKNYLDNNNISYDSHHSFDDLRGVNNGLLSYDFYLPDYNICIEAQGEQHEKPIDYFGGEERFKIQKEHDRRKSEYANINNISLLEIWYWQVDNVDTIISEYINNNQKVA